MMIIQIVLFATLESVLLKKKIIKEGGGGFTFEFASRIMVVSETSSGTLIITMQRF